MKKRNIPTVYKNLFLGIAIVILTIVIWGFLSVSAKGLEETPTVSAEQAEVQQLQAQIVELTAANATLTNKVGHYKNEYSKLKKVYLKLKNSSISSQRDKWHWKYLGLKNTWTRDDLRWAVKYEAKRRHLSVSTQNYLANAAVDIVFEGARESSGSNHCVSGQYVGMFQFGRSWGSVKHRSSGTWSVRRFVKVYIDGGEAALYRHWAATLGR